MFARRRNAALATVWLLALAATAGAQQQPRRVVLLYDERPELPGLARLDARFTKTLFTAMPGGVEVYREAMDLSRFGTQTYPFAFRDYLQAKYAEKRIDVVVAVMGPALDFVLAHGASVFPGASVVFCGIERHELAARRLPAHVTGVLLKREFAPTLAHALTLQPGARRVLYIAGSSEFDERLTTAARAQFAELALTLPMPTVEYHIGEPLPALLRTVAALPWNSIVLLSTVFADTAGKAYVPHEVAERVADAATAPVYAFVDQFLGSGVVGGHLYSLEKHGEAAAQLALSILRGATVAPPAEPASSVDAYDWRQLRRWNLDEHRVPTGSQIRFRELPPWERYRGAIVVILVLLALETALIGTLLVERRVRLRAQRALRESEARAQLAGVSLGVGVWTWESDQDRVWLSDQCARLLGIDAREPMSFVQFLEVVRPRAGGTSDIAFERALRGGLPFDGEWTVTSPGGDTRWIAGAIRTSDSVAGRRCVHGALIDVTERHAAAALAEEQRRELAHLSRVAVMGELSGTLAHELNQPLAAILVNARAAQRLIERDTLPMSDLHAILDDIVADDKRAGAVIHRVRALVRKGESDGEPQLLSLNDLVREVLELAHGDLVRREVTVQTRLASVPPLVSADRVQLQQMLLNLLMNACESMAGLPPAERRVAIMTGATESMARLEVRDRGPGFPDALLATAFEPFVTTKRQGMGLGLAICRSIVSAHGGDLQAMNAADQGASLVMTLPLAGEGAFSAMSWNSDEFKVLEH